MGMRWNAPVAYRIPSSDYVTRVQHRSVWSALASSHRVDSLRAPRTRQSPDGAVPPRVQRSLVQGFAEAGGHEGYGIGTEH